MSILPHQHRVLIERAELAQKQLALSNFFSTDIFKELKILDPEEANLLEEQYVVMTKYLQILDLRCNKIPDC